VAPLTLSTQWNVKFYNQGMYTDCNGLLTQSGSPFPGSSLFELASAGWPLDKLVIGKPASLYAVPSLRSPLIAKHQCSENDGYIAPNDLAACIGQAKARGWNGGVMSWQARWHLLFPILQVLMILLPVIRRRRGIMVSVRTLAVVAGLKAYGFPL
jgi:hypothetical protein